MKKLFERLRWELKGEQRAIDDSDFARVSLHQRSIRQLIVVLGDETKEIVDLYRRKTQKIRAAERKDNRR